MAIFADPARELIAVLDIGTSKVCCVIATVANDNPMLLGIGHQRSRGLKSGMVVDPEQAEQAIRAAVSQAERMAGQTVERVVLSVGCGRARSSTFRARAPIEGPVVRDGDIDRILAGGEAYLDRSGRFIVQLLRSDWRLDGAGGILDPRGLAGRELAIDLTAMTADDGPVRNLVGIVERCHLGVDRMAVSAYASALAVTTEEERRLGTVVIDMGAGLTALAAFSDGRLVHADGVAVGGNHVTFDIARELVASVQEAERIKTLYGTLVKAASNDGEVFTYQVAGDDEGGMNRASKAVVREIVKPRIDGLIELVVERMQPIGLMARRIVLTGGASQLVGLEQHWSHRLGTAVRVGRPTPIGRMPASMCTPAFATAMGLVGIGLEPPDRAGRAGRAYTVRRERSYLDRVHRWLRESF